MIKKVIISLRLSTECDHTYFIFFNLKIFIFFFITILILFFFLVIIFVTFVILIIIFQINNSILFILIFCNQITNILVSFLEFHLIHSFALIPMQESLSFVHFSKL